MRYMIRVETRDDKSNHNRGYHNYDATVTFEYADYEASHFAPDREEEIVQALLQPNGGMWYHAKNPSVGVWEVNHGYDSGD